MAVTVKMTGRIRKIRLIGASGLGLIPALVAFAIAVCIPAVAIFRQSLQANPMTTTTVDHETWDNYLVLIDQPTYRDAIIRTVWTSVVAAVASVIIGAAIVLGLTAFRKREPRSSFTVFILVAPILSGPIITVLGWVGLFSVNGVGYWVVNTFRELTGLPIGRVMETEVAMTIGLIHFLVPFVILTMYPIAKAVPRQLLDASLTLGHRPIGTIWRVMVPLCRPGIAAAGIVSLAMALGAFVNARFLGGERNLVLTTLVNQLINNFNPTVAAAASVMLIVVGLVLVALYGRLVIRLSAGGH